MGIWNWLIGKKEKIKILSVGDFDSKGDLSLDNIEYQNTWVVRELTSHVNGKKVNFWLIVYTCPYDKDTFHEDRYVPIFRKIRYWNNRKIMNWKIEKTEVDESESGGNEFYTYYPIFYNKKNIKKNGNR